MGRATCCDDTTGGNLRPEIVGCSGHDHRDALGIGYSSCMATKSAHSVAGGDLMKGFVQRSCRLPIPDDRKQMLRRPARGDLIGENTDAVARLLRAVRSGERDRVHLLAASNGFDQGERYRKTDDWISRLLRACAWSTASPLHLTRFKRVRE